MIRKDLVDKDMSNYLTLIKNSLHNGCNNILVKQHIIPKLLVSSHKYKKRKISEPIIDFTKMVELGELRQKKKSYQNVYQEVINKRVKNNMMMKRSEIQTMKRMSSMKTKIFNLEQNSKVMKKLEDDEKRFIKKQSMIKFHQSNTTFGWFKNVKNNITHLNSSLHRFASQQSPTKSSKKIDNRHLRKLKIQCINSQNSKIPKQSSRNLLNSNSENIIGWDVQQS